MEMNWDGEWNRCGQLSESALFLDVVSNPVRKQGRGMAKDTLDIFNNTYN